MNDKELKAKIDEIEHKVKVQICLNFIDKLSVFELLDLIDKKLRILYSSEYTPRDDKLSYSKAKEFISKTRTVLT